MPEEAPREFVGDLNKSCATARAKFFSFAIVDGTGSGENSLNSGLNEDLRRVGKRKEAVARRRCALGIMAGVLGAFNSQFTATHPILLSDAVTNEFCVFN